MWMLCVLPASEHHGTLSVRGRTGAHFQAHGVYSIRNRRTWLERAMGKGAAAGEKGQYIGTESVRSQTKLAAYVRGLNSEVLEITVQRLGLSSTHANLHHAQDGRCYRGTAIFTLNFIRVF